MLKKIPNILTIGRIIIVPFFVLAFYLPGFYGDLTALILFIIASFTDFLDGMLARILGEAEIISMPAKGNNPKKAIPKKNRKKTDKEAAPKVEEKKDQK